MLLKWPAKKTGSNSFWFQKTTWSSSLTRQLSWRRYAVWLNMSERNGRTCNLAVNRLVFSSALIVKQELTTESKTNPPHRFNSKNDFKSEFAVRSEFKHHVCFFCAAKLTACFTPQKHISFMFLCTAGKNTYECPQTSSSFFSPYLGDCWHRGWTQRLAEMTLPSFSAPAGWHTTNSHR